MRQRSGLFAVIFCALSLGACQRDGAPALKDQDDASTRAPHPSRAKPLSQPVGWLKGQTHLHSGNSGDSQTPPEQVVAWYAARGYDFIVFTDHNVVTTPPAHPKMLTIPGVELTQNYAQCEPPPAPEQGCLLHINALFTQTPTSPQEAQVSFEEPTDLSRRALFNRAIAVSKARGGISQLNHPNFHYAADAGLIAQLAADGVQLLEIANESIGCNNEGDQDHPSTEALWDLALSQGARIYGVATDDAHHYEDAQALKARGEPYYVGDLGFVMVRAKAELSAIREAMLRGDFYSSTGVLLGRVERAQGALHIEVDQAQAPVTISFIGKGGEVLATHQGLSASHPLPEANTAGYLRAVVVDARGKKAWVQPQWP